MFEGEAPPPLQRIDMLWKRVGDAEREYDLPPPSSSPAHSSSYSSSSSPIQGSPPPSLTVHSATGVTHLGRLRDNPGVRRLPFGVSRRGDSCPPICPDYRAPNCAFEGGKPRAIPGRAHPGGLGGRRRSSEATREGPRRATTSSMAQDGPRWPEGGAGRPKMAPPRLSLASRRPKKPAKRPKRAPRGAREILQTLSGNHELCPF